MYNLRYVISVHGKPFGKLLKCKAGEFAFDTFKVQTDVLNNI